MTKQLFVWLLGVLAVSTARAAAGTEGDPQRGAEAFRRCIACHSIEPGRHLTGPSLAGIVGRRAGTAEGFHRYSEALASIRFTWDRETLDRWLADPEAMVPGTSMRIPPIADAGMRRDLIAYLEAGVQSSGERTTGEPRQGQRSGGMQGDTRLNLKEQSPSQTVKGITYCGDAYRVTLGNGKMFVFWEFNLRFKTDSSEDGPPSGEPAIVRAGMMGDRAFVVFADPEEISSFIRKKCAGG